MPFGVFIHFKTSPNGTNVKLTFRQYANADVYNNRVSISRLTTCFSYENLHYYPQIYFSKSDRSKLNHIYLSFMQFLKLNRHETLHFTRLSIAVDDKMAVFFLLSKQK